jgi:Mg2+ and Co2+ transporter CorA
MKEYKLNQIIAIEKGVKSRTYGDITNLHKLNQKADLFNGFNKNYQPKDEEGEKLPPETKKVTMRADESLNALNKSLTELFDITLTKDMANTQAIAQLKIGDSIVDAPATFLLFLEKQIADIRTFVNNLPVLDSAEDWNKDDNTGLYKTSPTLTHRTKKVQRPLVLYDATDKHPAQTQLIVEDITVGYWNVIKQSGAIPENRKKEILERIEELTKQVKSAREKANMVDAENKEIGYTLFSYLFK